MVTGGVVRMETVITGVAQHLKVLGLITPRGQEV
jgi:hypothetical protein